MHAVTIRSAGPPDQQALRRLAQLDSARLPAGELLVAEVEGALIAAAAVAGESVIADPFRRTADVVALLRARAAQMQRQGPHPERGFLRPRGRSRGVPQPGPATAA